MKTERELEEDKKRKVADRRRVRAANQKARYAYDPEYKARHLEVCRKYRERLITADKNALASSASIHT
jgi:hypothetical protein